MRNKVILGLALIFGLLAAFLIYNYLNHVKDVTENKEYTQVVTAAQNIPANTAITDVMVEMKPFPTELRSGKELVNTSAAMGRISSVAINKGEVLMENRLIKPGESTERLSYVVPEGKRAMTIPVTETTGVAYLIKKGDRVDIVTVVPAGGNKPVDTGVVVLQNVEVLTVGKVLNPSSTAVEDAAEPATVTVAVDLQSAVKLKLALDNTKVSLVLRSAADQNVTNTAPFTMNQF